MSPSRDQLIDLILRETTDKVTADGVQIAAPNILEVGCRYVRGDPRRGYEKPAEAARQFAGFIADAVLALPLSQGQASAASHPCYDEHQPGCDCVIPEQTAAAMPSYLERLAPTVKASGSERERLIEVVLSFPETVDLPTQRAEDLATTILAALRSQPAGAVDLNELDHIAEHLSTVGRITDGNTVIAAAVEIARLRVAHASPTADEGKRRIAIEKLESIRLMRSDRPSGPYPKSYKGGFDAAADLMSGWATEALVAMDAERRP